MCTVNYTYQQLSELATREVHHDYSDCFINAITQNWHGVTKVKVNNNFIEIFVHYFGSVATAQITRDLEVTIVFTINKYCNIDSAGVIDIFLAKFIGQYMIYDFKFGWSTWWGSLNEICYDAKGFEVEPGTNLSAWCGEIENHLDEEAEDNLNGEIKGRVEITTLTFSMEVRDIPMVFFK